MTSVPGIRSRRAPVPPSPRSVSLSVLQELCFSPDPGSIRGSRVPSGDPPEGLDLRSSGSDISNAAEKAESGNPELAAGPPRMKLRKWGTKMTHRPFSAIPSGPIYCRRAPSHGPIAMLHRDAPSVSFIEANPESTSWYAPDCAPCGSARSTLPAPRCECWREAARRTR